MIPETDVIFEFIRLNAGEYLKDISDEQIKEFIDLYKKRNRTYIVNDEFGLMAWGAWDELGETGVVRELVVRKDKRGYRALKHLIALLKVRRMHLTHIKYERQGKGRSFKTYSINKILRRK
jgi:hypothetical protein